MFREFTFLVSLLLAASAFGAEAPGDSCNLALKRRPIPGLTDELVALRQSENLGVPFGGETAHRELWDWLSQPSVDGPRILEFISHDEQVRSRLTTNSEHTRRMWELFGQQLAATLADPPIAAPAGVDLPVLMKFAIAWQDVGLGEVAIGDKLESRHLERLPLLAEFMERQGFSRLEIALAKAVLDNDPIRDLFEGHVSPVQASQHIAALATRVSLKPIELFRLQTTVVAADLKAADKSVVAKDGRDRRALLFGPYIRPPAKDKLELGGQPFDTLRKLLDAPVGEPIQKDPRLRENLETSRLPEMADPIYYLRGLPPTPKELLQARLEAVAKLNGVEIPGPAYFLLMENEPGVVYAVGSWLKPDWRGEKRVVFAGDLVIEEPDLADGNFGKREYLFAPGGRAVTGSRPVSLRLIENLTGDVIRLRRVLSTTELNAWDDGDLDFLRSSHPNPPYATAMKGGIPEQVVWFSVDVPIFHRVAGSEVISIEIPKNQLLEWAKQDMAIAGRAHARPGDPLQYNMLELALTMSSWSELAPFIIDRGGPEVAEPRKRARSEKVAELDAELRQELDHARFTPLDLAIKRSGLAPVQLALLRQKSAGLYSVDQFLRLGGLENAPAIGPPHQTFDSVSVLARFKTLDLLGWNVVPRSHEEPLKYVSNLLAEKTAGGAPFVMFVRGDIFDSRNPYGGFTDYITLDRFALTWFILHPDRMRNVRFVFGADDMYTPIETPLFEALRKNTDQQIAMKSEALRHR